MSDETFDDALPVSRAPSVMLVIAAATVSTAALGLLLHLHTRPPPPAPRLVFAPPTTTVATTVAAAAPVAPVELPPAPTQALDRLATPNFTNMRLPAARRHARELGLRLVVRDPWHQAVDATLAPSYRVTSQAIAPGTPIALGGVVHAVAADPTPIVAGY